MCHRQLQVNKRCAKSFWYMLEVIRKTMCTTLKSTGIPDASHPISTNYIRRCGGGVLIQALYQILVPLCAAMHFVFLLHFLCFTCVATQIQYRRKRTKHMHYSGMCTVFRCIPAIPPGGGGENEKQHRPPLLVPVPQPKTPQFPSQLLAASSHTARRAVRAA